MPGDKEVNDSRDPAPPTSEVGFAWRLPVPADNDGESRWRLLLEQQNQGIMALIQAVRTPTMNTGVILPEFDPDNTEIDARSWAVTADICMSDQPLEGAQLMILLSRALKGTASAWLA